MGRRAMGDRPRGGRGIRYVLGLSAAVGIVLCLIWQTQPPVPPPSSGDTPPHPQEASALPPYSDSGFLNSGPDAHYIGTEACVKCHAGKYRSYARSPHSRALSDLDPKAEPPDGSFRQEVSGRFYRVYRQGNQLRHEESLRTAEGKEIARVDLPVRYLIGSGHFCRSYLAEVDGFLLESPITWYTAKQKWDMSPGYQFAQHWSFERGVGTECLACHAGRVEAAGTPKPRIRFHEKAIGCENCHGPGSLHVNLRRASGSPVPADEDRTIVNPRKLSRARLEDICAVCHLSGAATVTLRGRQSSNFRPGMALSDFRVHYRFDTGSSRMAIVGHVEQLRQSACYQKSPELTCVTCHDPHAREKPADQIAFYRQKCLSCHDVQACGLKQAERLKRDPTDSCVACHMPRGDTEVPHVVFTHHRIGVHTPQPQPSATTPQGLVPIEDVRQLPVLDQQRNLGLACLEVSRKPEYAAYAQALPEQARQLLEGVHAAGLRDGVTAETLAEIYWGKDPVRTRLYAREALETADLPSDKHALALLLLADCDMREHAFASAANRLEELVRLRRFAEDWRLLGLCYLMQNQPEKALAALQQALAIRPFRPDIHSVLARTYRQLGDLQHAREHSEKAEWLAQHGQQ